MTKTRFAASVRQRFFGNAEVVLVAGAHRSRPHLVVDVLLLNSLAGCYYTGVYAIM